LFWTGDWRLVTADYGAALLEPTDLQRRGRLHRLALPGEILFWISGKLGDAAFGAEVVRFPAVLDVSCGTLGIDHHPAHGIEHAFGHAI